MTGRAGCHAGLMNMFFLQAVRDALLFLIYPAYIKDSYGCPFCLHQSVPRLIIRMALTLDFSMSACSRELK